MYGSVRGTRGNSRPYRDKRREVLTLFGGAATASPFTVHGSSRRCRGRQYRPREATIVDAVFQRD
jgi:hypothetical protein